MHAFSDEGLEVIRLVDDELLRETVRNRGVAALIMDRMVDGTDSLEILEDLRAAGDRMPVVVVSSLSSVDDRIKGLKAGGDDYLVKPFAMGELIARVQAVTRRAGDDRKIAVTAGPLHMDLIGPSVTIPIFDGGTRHAQLEAAYVRRDQALAHYRQVILVAIQEVEDALSTQHHLASENQRLAAAVASEKKVLDLSLTLYRDGATTYLDVVVAQEALLGQQRASLALTTRDIDAGVSLIVALGGGWVGDAHLASDKPI